MASFLLAPPEFSALEVDYVDQQGEDGKLKLRLRVFTCADAGRIEAKYGRDWLATIAEVADMNAAVAILAGQIENADEVLGHFPDEDDIEAGLKRVIPVSPEAVVGILQELANLYRRAHEDSAKKKRRLRRNRLLRTGLRSCALSLFVGAAALSLWMML